MCVEEVNEKDEYGETALYKACRRKNNQAVSLLLAKPGINVNVKNSYYGRTPLQKHSSSFTAPILLILFIIYNIFRSIILSGKIKASLSFMAGGDTAFGNGVYLTKLSPETSIKIQIAKNNWANTSAQFIRKTENYFVIDIKESDVKDTNATDRNIFTFGS